MCYAIPGRVVKVNGRFAIVDYYGEERKCLNDLEKVQEGDYVYAQGGVIVDKISEQEAVEILKHWKKIFDELQKKDAELSQEGEYPEKDLEKEELLKMFEKNADDLGKIANKKRSKYLKNSCCIHGIIEFSNYCRNDCAYCGIRKSKEQNRYRMDVDEMVELADYAVNTLGFKALVLQSGEDSYYTKEMLCEIIRKIRQKCGVLLFMSVGTRSKECYKSMYQAGARGVLLRFESSNKELYAKIHLGRKADFEKRIELIKYCYSLGYLIATGFILGIPGQTKEDIVNDILLTKELGAEMYSFGPLIPCENTPLADAERVDLELAIKTIALSRLADAEGKILVTTALETLNEKGREKGLMAGANSLMLNVTPTEYKNKYTIYPNRADKMIDIRKNISRTLKLLYSLGRAPTDLGVKNDL